MTFRKYNKFYDIKRNFDVAKLYSAKHRTSISRVLLSSSWNEKLLEKALKIFISLDKSLTPLNILIQYNDR